MEKEGKWDTEPDTAAAAALLRDYAIGGISRDLASVPGLIIGYLNYSFGPRLQLEFSPFFAKKTKQNEKGKISRSIYREDEPCVVGQYGVKKHGARRAFIFSRIRVTRARANFL